jgi:hypothetical protein
MTMATQQARTRMKVVEAAVPDVTVPDAGAAALARWTTESLFGAGGTRPPRRGFEPGFVLVESHVMEALRRRAADRGVAYDALVRLIVRDHVDEY